MLRREGLVPAEVYGRGVENRHLAVSVKEFAALYRTAGSHTIVTLVENGDKTPAMIAEVMRDPLTDEILAVDFHAIKKGERVRAKVPVVFVGASAAVKAAGYILVEVVHEIEIEALPEHLLHRIEVPVDKLEKPGDSIAVKDLAIPADVKLHIPEDMVLVTVREHVVEKIETPPPAAEASPAEGATPPEGAATPETTQKKE